MAEPRFALGAIIEPGNGRIEKQVDVFKAQSVIGTG